MNTAQNGYNKYINNKNAYLNLSKQIGGTTKYYVIHYTDYKNLIKILKTKCLKSNKHIDKKYWRLSGNVPSKYIYLSLIKGSDEIIDFGIALIFSEKILHENQFVFNNGWIGEPTIDSIFIDPKKTLNISRNLDNIHKLISNKKITDHEILFHEKINLDNLVAIHCPKCSNEKIQKVKKYLKNDNVKIYKNDSFYLEP